MNDMFRSGTRVLVQRGRMGGRDIHTANLTLQEQNGIVPPRPEMDGADAREQRLLDADHAVEIAEYITEIDDYYLPSLMVLLHAAPEFEPLKDSNGEVLTDKIGWLWIDAKIGKTLGDGMHRGVGIEGAINGPARERIQDDTIVVSFVVEPDRLKRKQLFNDINRTQKRVAKSLGVSFDSRDPIAQAVNEVVDQHPLGELIEREKGTAGRGTGKLMTTGTLFDAVSTICYGWSGKPGRRNGKVSVEQAREACELLIDALMAMPEIQDVLDAANPGLAADELRKRSILGSGATVKALAGALFVARGESGSDEAVRASLPALQDVDWSPSAWVSGGFVPQGGRTPSSRSQEVRAAGFTIAGYLGRRAA